MQNIELRAHWELVANSMQVVFNILADLSEVDEKYTKHLERQTPIGEVKALGVSRIGSISGNQPVQKVQSQGVGQSGMHDQAKTEQKTKERYVTQVSEMVFKMPDFKLVVPQNFENENLLLCVDSDIGYTSTSEQHVL